MALIKEDPEEGTYEIGYTFVKTVVSTKDKFEELTNCVADTYINFRKEYLKNNVGTIFPEYVKECIKFVIEQKASAIIQQWIDAGDAASAPLDPILGVTPLNCTVFEKTIAMYTITNDGLIINRQSAAYSAGTAHASTIIH